VTVHAQPRLVSSLDRPDRELEEQAERIARRTSRATRPDATWDGSGAVPDALRRPVEAELGTDLSTTRLRRDGPIAERLVPRGADAAASGDEVHVAPGRFHPGHVEGLELLQHELVHLAQQQRSARATGDRPSGRPSSGGASADALPAARGSLQLGSCG